MEIVLTWELLHNPMNLVAFHINYKVVFSFPTFHKPKNDVKRVIKATVGVLSYSFEFLFLLQQLTIYFIECF